MIFDYRYLFYQIIIVRPCSNALLSSDFSNPCVKKMLYRDPLMYQNPHSLIRDRERREEIMGLRDVDFGGLVE